jgi:hypothetical protein
MEQQQSEYLIKSKDKIVEVFPNKGLLNQSV